MNMNTSLRLTVNVLLLAISQLVPNGSHGGQAYIVPGTSDPWLSGMPAGSTASGPPCGGIDTAPAQSPVEVTGIQFVGGQGMYFRAEGGVGNGPGFPPHGSSTTDCPRTAQRIISTPMETA
jgi:hypothetical protein